VERTEYEVTIDPVPDIREMKYGPHFRHSINFYKAKSDQPTPLVLNIHGGGWGALDKSAAQISFNGLLGAGISVASINYRFVSQAEADGVEPPVEACLTDAARALQFLRSKAEELNIDKQRIGATGGSAGGATTLWLALHDDLADPDSDDPPIFQNYGGRGIEEASGERGWKTHSPLFGVGLKRRLDEVGVENYLAYDRKPARKYGNPVAFFIAKLKEK